MNTTSDRFAGLRLFTARMGYEPNMRGFVLVLSVIPLAAEDQWREVRVVVDDPEDFDGAYIQAKRILSDDFATRGITIPWSVLTAEEYASIRSCGGFRFQRPQEPIVVSEGVSDDDWEHAVNAMILDVHSRRRRRTHGE
jgi:hypothetical protein